MHNVPTLLTKGIHRLVEQYGGDIHPVRLKPAESSNARSTTAAASETPNDRSSNPDPARHARRIGSRKVAKTSPDPAASQAITCADIVATSVIGSPSAKRSKSMKTARPGETTT